MSNASKFTAEQGNIIFEIEELACDLSEHALLQFTFVDTGTGIHPEFLPHIFDVFTRERDSRVDKTEGSGLGMAITKKLTELLGGTIHLESEPGKGSTFQVRLPMKTAAGAPAPAPCGGLKVLVVDNDEIACKYLVQTLKELHMDAFWVGNGEDALKKISEVQNTGQDFDIVLLDWSEIEDQAVQAGINGFIQKPLFKTTLCKEIQNCLFGRQALPQTKSFPDFHGKRLLLVEDNVLNLEIAEELLQTMGASVDIAQNGAIGIAQFQQSDQGHYDMILMELRGRTPSGSAPYVTIYSFKFFICIAWPASFSSFVLVGSSRS